MTSNFETWIRENRIGEVECLVPDMNGIIRGKVVPAQKFLEIERNQALRIPSSVYIITVTGEYPDDESNELAVLDPDVVLQPDLSTACVAPGYKTPTAFVIADACHADGRPYEISPALCAEAGAGALRGARLAAGDRAPSSNST